MIDLVFNSVYFDIGRVYDIGGLASAFNGIHKSMNRDIASYYAAREAAMETALEQILNDYFKLDH